MRSARREAGLVLRLVKRLRPLALTIGAVISVVFPATFYVVGLLQLGQHAEVEAQEVEARLRGLILEDPTLWKFQGQQLLAVFEQQSVVPGMVVMRILDASGKTIMSHEPGGPGPVARFDWLTVSRTAPLVFNNRTLGAVSVSLSQGSLLGQTLVFLLVSVATGAALGVLVFRMPVAALQRASSRVEALLATSRQLAGNESVDVLLEHIALACGELIDSDSVGIRMVEGDELVLRGTRGDARAAMPIERLRFGESLSGRVATTGKPLVVNDYPDDPRVVPAHREAARRLGYRHYLGVPVQLGERLFGVLSARTRRAAGFSAEDLALVTAFAAQAAAVLENARLYEATRQAGEELARTQEQFLQAQKMEAIGTLAGGVAHDFNNLLTIITGRTALLRTAIGDDGRLDRHVELIEKASQRAVALTRQLLAFSRKQVLQPKVLDLNAVVSGLMGLLRRLIREDIELVFVHGPGKGRVKADPTQLEQVLVNLVVNARDAMPSGGRLTIGTTEVELDGRYARGHLGARPGRYVMLGVSDTGIGMDAATRARIFEPFFTTKAVGEGTGLGLSTVYGIVKQSDGYIDVYSEPGKGTSFKIYLPRVDEAVEAPGELPAKTAPPAGTETILLVEDEDDLRDLVQETLQNAGYTVLEARLPDVAIHVAGHHASGIQLVVTDVIMPQMDGRALADRLVQVRPELKVLYMSGYTDDAVVHHGVLDPGTAFIHKPFTPDALLRAVRATLDRRNGA